MGLVILSICSVFDFSIYAYFSSSDMLLWNKILIHVSVKLVIFFPELKLVINGNKAIIVNLNKGEKLNGDNFDIWHRKVTFIIKDQEATEALHTTMKKPQDGDSVQSKRDMEAYEAWKKKNSTARLTLLSSMDNYIMCQYEHYRSAYEMWLALKKDFGGSL